MKAMSIRNTLLTSYYKSSKFFYDRGFGKFPLVMTIATKFRSYVTPNFIEINGHKLFLDKIDAQNLWMDNDFEKSEVESFKKLIKKGNIVLDIGTYIGLHTLTFAKLVGNQGKVISFEPVPNNFALLKKNVEINGYTNVILVNKAVSNKNGNEKLYLSNHNPGDNRLGNFGKEFDKSIEVETIRIDDYLENSDVDFIKMDIQGSEPFAIEGMSILLQKKSIKIVMEFWPFGINQNKINVKEFLEKLSSYGFSFYDFGMHKECSIDQLLIEYTYDNKKWTNLLCQKNS